MKRAPGRPRISDRIALDAAVLGAALTAFLELGYDSTSMEEVARRTGISKQTLYARFSDKQALFAAVIAERFNQQIASPLEQHEILTLAPRDFLERTGRNVLHNLHTVESRKLRRLVRSVHNRFPDIGKAFWQNGPNRGRTLVRKYLIAQCEAGKLSIPDVELAVEQFLGMIMGLSDLRESVGLFPGHFSAAQEAKWVCGAVDVFLAFYEVT